MVEEMNGSWRPVCLVWTLPLCGVAPSLSWFPITGNSLTWESWLVDMFITSVDRLFYVICRIVKGAQRRKYCWVSFTMELYGYVAVFAKMRCFGVLNFAVGNSYCWSSLIIVLR